LEKKISLAEAVKQKLAQQKEAQANANAQQKNVPNSSQRMKNQINKKPNNQKRRTGV
jgi:hypothetical protein